MTSPQAKRCGALGAAALGGLTACASPREHLYSLDNSSSEIPTAVRERATVLVGPVNLPELVDRPQLVVRAGAYDIIINEQERWAASQSPMTSPLGWCAKADARIAGAPFGADIVLARSHWGTSRCPPGRA
jgi:ABC-type transport auxiliary lipoprotein component